MAYEVHFGTNRVTSDHSVWRLTAAGVKEWDVDPSDKANCVAVDPDGYVYFGGWGVHKYTSAGVLVWTDPFNDSDVGGIAVDKDGHVLAAGGYDAAADNIFLYDSDGSTLWSKDHGSNLHCAAMDADGNCFVGGNGAVSVRAYDNLGNVLWTKAQDFPVVSIAIDRMGYIYTYTSELADGANALRKYAPDGTEVTTNGFPILVPMAWDGGAYAIAIDGGGYLYVANETDGGVSIRKYDPTGVLQWEADYGTWLPFCIAVSLDGYVYVGGDSEVEGEQARKFSADTGAEIGGNWPYGFDAEENRPYGVAVSPGLVGAFPGSWPAIDAGGGYPGSPPFIYVGDVLYE